MKLGFKIPTIDLPRHNRGSAKGRTAFVQWDRQSLVYLVVAKERGQLRTVSHDKVDRQLDQPPLQQVSDLLKQDRISVSQFVVLLSRAELEMVNVTLPPAQADEIPDLVRSQVEEQVGDGDQAPQVDYLLSQFEPEKGGEALAFAINPQALEALKKQAKQAGARLAAVTPRSLAPLGLLHQVPSLSSHLAIAITLFDAEIELLVLHHGKPGTARTIRSRTDEMQAVADQVAMEVQRCLAVAKDLGEEDSLHLFVFGDREIFSPLVDTLVEQFDGPVSLLNPLDSMQVDRAVDRRACHLYAALTGAANSFYLRELTVDLLEPKRAPRAPNPIRRWAMIAAVAVAALFAVVFVLAGELQELSRQVEEKEKQFTAKANMARKRQEKADELRVAEDWLRDEVNWLEELRALSETLPGGQDVTIRRLTAAATPSGSVVDLSVQVSQPEKVAELENRMREIGTSVSSKRVSEQSSDEDYPWQFETRVLLPRRPPVVAASESSSASESPADGNQAEGEPPTDAIEDSSPTKLPAGRRRGLMNRRTVFLVAGAVAVGLLWGGDQLFRRYYEQPKTRLENRLDKLAQDLIKAQRAEVSGKATTKELEYLVQYSLPYDGELARSAYQDWLLALVKTHGMENASVDAPLPRAVSVAGRVRRGSRLVAQRLSFSVRAKTDPNQLTAFLYDFYRAGHLHKITSLALNPLAGGRKIDLTLTIEALSLDACDRKAELSPLVWHRLADQDAKAYAGFAQRNIFARGVSKLLADLQLAGVTYNRKGVAEAWFALGADRRTEIVAQGGYLEVDLLQVEVVEIRPTQVRVSIQGQAVWLDIGQRVGDKFGVKDPNVARSE